MTRRSTGPQASWEARRENIIGAHSAGIEPAFRFRRDLGLHRAPIVVGAVGATSTLAAAVDAGRLAG